MQSTFLPIDTSQMSFRAADEPRPVLDFNDRTPRATKHGEPIYSVRMYADELGRVISVKVAGEPEGIGRKTDLTVTGLTAIFWETDERKGLSFRAERIEPIAVARRAAS
jgi:hypothetical protein